VNVDAHQHYWRLDRGDYAWLRPDVAGLAPLYRDFQPADLQDTLARHGIGATVLVQAADTTAETDYLLELAARHRSIGGVVGWVDLSRADSVATLERWMAPSTVPGAAAPGLLKSVRPMLQDLPQADWIAHAPHPAAMQALQRLGLRFDALVKPWHLQALLTFARRHPGLPIVVDHAAKPQLASGWQAEWAEPWRRGIAELAALPQVVCKVSGLLTEMSPAQCRDRDTALATLRPVWDTLLETFGPARLMWGSDWPVLTLAASYNDWVGLSEALIGELTPEEGAALRWCTATRFYDLPNAGMA
jgi:L-fuconolactonase